MSDKSILKGIFIKFGGEKFFTTQWKIFFDFFYFFYKTKQNKKHYSCPQEVCPIQDSEKISMWNIGLLPGRTSKEGFILRGAESNWLNQDNSALKMNILCLLVWLHFLDGLQEIS